MTDWVTDGIEAVGRDAAIYREQRALANFRAFIVHGQPDEASRANALARWSKLPGDTVQDQYLFYHRLGQLDRESGIIRDTPGMHDWLGDPRNAQAAQGDIPNLAAVSTLYAPPGPGIPRGLLNGNAWARTTEWRERTPEDIMYQSGNQPQQPRLSRAQMIEEGRPAPTLSNLWHGLAVDTVEGFKQSYYGLAMYLLDAMGMGTPDGYDDNKIDPNAPRGLDYFLSWQHAYQASQERAQGERPKIESPTGQAVYGGVSSFMQMLPALLAAPFTDGTSLLTLIGTQTGTNAYGKYRSRGGSANEALAGGVLEGTIEGVTEALPLGWLTGGFGKKGAGAFISGFLIREMGTEQLATVLQDAVDTAIANPDATWAQYWADRPRAAFDTAAAVFIASGAIGGSHAVASKLFPQVREADETITAMAGTKFLDALVDNASRSSVFKNDPEGFAEYLQGQADGTPIDRVYVPVETLRSMFQSEGKDYRIDPFWSKYQDQIDQASSIGGDVVLPIGEAVVGFAQEEVWGNLRDAVRLSPGGMSLSEARSIEESYKEIMSKQAAEVADATEVSRAEVAPQQRVYDSVFSQARQAGFSINSSRAYADLWSARYATRAAQRGTDAWSLYGQSVAGIFSEIPDTVRTYKSADEVSRLINVMKRDRAAPSETQVKGQSLLEWIAARGGIEDPGGDVASMGGDKWHRQRQFRRRLIKAVEDAKQGNLLGKQRGSSINSPDVMLKDAIDAGYFPELVGKENTDSGYADKADVSTLYSAIERELGGQPVYSQDRGGSDATLADADIRAAAEDLRGFLETRDIDPDTATDEEIRAALKDSETGSPATRAFDQMRAWNEPPPGMAPDLVLHHNGPEGLPRGRPGGSRDRAWYFGTQAFSDAVGATDFGPWRYTFFVPQAVADRIVTIEAGSETGLALARDAAHRAFPDDATGFDAQLAEADPDALADFYSDVWTDPFRMQDAIRDAGLLGVRLNDEYLLLPEAVRQLVDRRMGPDDGTISFYQSQPEHPPFYSALLRAVEGFKTAKAPAAQWKSTILNASGVKAEEVEWSGLLEWLDEQPGVVSRTDVEQFLRSGGIRVSEVVLGEYGPDVARAVQRKAEQLYEDWVRTETFKAMQDLDVEFPGEHVPIEEVDEGFHVDGWTYDTLAEAEEVAADLEAAAEHEWEMRQREQVESEVRRRKDDEDFIDEAKRAVGALTEFSDWTTTQQATPTYRELLITLPIGEGKNPTKAPETHWSQSAVVAHARFQAKQDEQGRPVLFVEEVQSDWHQKGRDQGYAVPVPPEEVAKLYARVEAAQGKLTETSLALVSLADRYGINPPDEAPAPERDFAGFIFRDQPLDERVSWSDRALRKWQDGQLVNGIDPGPFDPERDALIGKARQDWKDAILRLNEAGQVYANSLEPRGIPFAPFKSSWPALVMKRLIRWAADNGYHSVAWTTGDQQNERYSLETSLGGSVTVWRADDGRIVMKPEDDVAEDMIIDQYGLEENGGPNDRGFLLSNQQALEIFGDGLGQRIIDAATEQGETSDGPGIVLRGHDLSVGGSGMRGFYDRNLVNITDGLIKKYGAKVHKARVLDEQDEQDAAERIAARDEAQAVLDQPDATPEARALAERKVAFQTEQLGLMGQEQWLFEVTPKMAEAARAGFSLFQGGESKPRGRIDFQRDGAAAIRLFEGRDLSTLLHEGGHLWLEELRADANAANAPQSVRDDWQTVRAWFKANGHDFAEGGDIPTEAHELWARGMERYFMEGKAPTSALSSAFSSFRAWLLRIYQVVVNLKTPLTDDVRRVMDRLIATEEAINEQAQLEESAPLFKTSAEAGMTDAEFAAYTASAQRVRTEAFDALLYRTMEAIRRERTAEWKGKRDQVRREIEEEVRARPEFRALAILRGRGVPQVSLNRDEFVAEFGTDALDLMPRGVPPTISEKGGVHPDVLAEMAGFASGRQMVDMLMGVEARQRELRLAQDKRSVLQETIDLGVAKTMAERFGDPLSDGSIEEEALGAIHSEGRAQLIASEVRALSRMARPGGPAGYQLPTPASVAREWAERRVRDGKVSDEATAAALLRHRRAEAKAAKLAGEALLDGNVDEAFRQKQAQLYHNALARAAKRAKDRVEVIARRLNKYAKARKLPSMDADYLAQIHGLLENYEFRVRSGPERKERASFSAWVKAREEAGEEVYVPPRLHDAERINFKDVTFGELVGLDDTVASIAHLGRRKKTMRTGREERDYEEFINQTLAASEAMPSRKFKATLNKPQSTVRSLISSAVTVERMADFMDNYDPNGGFNKALILGARDSANRYAKIGREILQPITERWLNMSRAQQRRFYERVTVPELMTIDPDTREIKPLTVLRSDLVAMALNTGTPSNLDKMLRGENLQWRQMPDYQLTEAKLMQALNRELSAEDWQFVQDMWEAVGGLWPHIVAAEKEISGVAPEKVETREVTTAHGTLAGGYWPVVYDPDPNRAKLAGFDATRNAEKDSQTLFGQIGRAVSTPNGHTISRTNYAAPMLFSLEAVLFNHIRRVATRAAYGAWSREALKFINDPRIEEIFSRKLGREYFAQIFPWLRDQINDAALDTADLRGIDKLMRTARTNASAVGLVFRFTTLLTQVFGVTNSMAEIGPGAVLNGYAQATIGMGRAQKEAFALSEELARRAGEFDRDMESALRDMRNPPRTEIGRALAPLKSIKDKWNALGFHLIGMVQLHLVDVPLWLGAYKKGLADDMTQEEAINFADKSVRKSQGSGLAKDQAAIQRGREAYKVFTTFYTYWGTVLNYQWEVGQALRSGNHKRALAKTWWVMIAGPLLSAFFLDPPDDDEDWTHWAMRTVFFGLWGGVPLIRDYAAKWNREAGGKYTPEPTTPGGRIVGSVKGTLADAMGAVGQTEAYAQAQAVIPALPDQKEPSERWLKHLIEAFGYLSGMGTGQLATTTQYVADVAEGDQKPQDAGDVAKGVIKGPQPDQ